MGSHSTSTRHVCDAPNELSHVSATFRNGGAVEILEMSIEVFLELLAANTLCAALGVPTVTVPKFKLFVLRFRWAFPFPEFLAKAAVDVTSPIAKSRAKLRTEKAKRDGFGRDMRIPLRISGATRSNPVLYFPPQHEFTDRSRSGTRLLCFEFHALNRDLRRYSKTRICASTFF